jgi:alpha-galactosidase
MACWMWDTRFLILMVSNRWVVNTDCWMDANRTDTGELVGDLQRFPSGISYLADSLHAMGFKFGLYESAGPETCDGFPGSLG